MTIADWLLKLIFIHTVAAFIFLFSREQFCDSATFCSADAYRLHGYVLYKVDSFSSFISFFAIFLRHWISVFRLRIKLTQLIVLRYMQHEAIFCK